jgi:hypothetical protein
MGPRVPGTIFDRMTYGMSLGTLLIIISRGPTAPRIETYSSGERKVVPWKVRSYAFFALEAVLYRHFSD